MKVFSNTTPFIALASIQRLDLLPRLFGQVHVTEEVISECAVGGPVAVPLLRELDSRRIVGRAFRLIDVHDRWGGNPA